MASAMERRYQLAREEISTQQRGQTEQEKEALKRRFATIGGLGSGASIKAEQSAEREGARRLATGMSAITQQELGDKQRLEEIDEGRKFQTSERLGGQTFSTGEREAGQIFVSGENKIGREFQTSERAGAQTFSSAEADKQRGFMTGERVAGQQFQTSERAGAQTFSSGEKQRMEKLEERGIVIQEAELAESIKVSQANLDNAAKSAKDNEDKSKGGIFTTVAGSSAGRKWNESVFGTGWTNKKKWKI